MVCSCISEIETGECRRVNSRPAQTRDFGEIVYDLRRIGPVEVRWIVRRSLLYVLRRVLENERRIRRRETISIEHEGVK